MALRHGVCTRWLGRVVGGSSLAKLIDCHELLLAFAIAMAAIAISMLRQPKSEGAPFVHFSWKLVAR